ncbi:MAG: dUTP diphosphatase [Candidatus Pacebacteria bacterium]|nr:dUTP diphosphatase [Candidatus Paceibacterota bacterium]NUQ57130.1 dUTP diphosphatase [Candidatus Paceibacter sp.]
MLIKFQRISAEAVIPSYAHPGDAGMDVFSTEEALIKAGERKNVRTGVKMEMPEGYAALVWDKSGLAAKDGIKTMAGVIDSGYRGEIVIVLVNLSQKDFEIKKGQKIAQMLIQKVERPEIEEAENLNESKRGEGGFGSTGLF